MWSGGRVVTTGAATVRPGDLGDLFAPVSGDTATVLGGEAVLLVDATVGVPPAGWSPGSVPVVVVAVVSGTAGDAALVDPSPYDVLLAEDDPMLTAILSQVAACPVAAVSLAVLLRGGESRTVDEGLAAESAVYSTLQAGPEFGAWRASPGATSCPRIPADGADRARRRRVASCSTGRTATTPITVELRDEFSGVDDRGRRRLDPAVRLSAATARRSAAAATSVSSVDVPDPATAHVTRLTRAARPGSPTAPPTRCMCTCTVRPSAPGSRWRRSPAA